MPFQFGNVDNRRASFVKIGATSGPMYGWMDREVELAV
jgi:hypothetical protein